jgi:hypothetical protein
MQTKNRKKKIKKKIMQTSSFYGPQGDNFLILIISKVKIPTNRRCGQEGSLGPLTSYGRRFLYVRRFSCLER